MDTYSEAQVAQIRIAQALIELAEDDTKNVNLLWWLERIALTIWETTQKHDYLKADAGAVDWLNWFEVSCYFQDLGYALEKGDEQFANRSQEFKKRVGTRLDNVLRSLE